MSAHPDLSPQPLPGPPRPAPPRALGGAPPELERAFRLIAFDWDGTAVASRTADASRVGQLITALLEAGTRIAIVTGTNLTHVLNQLKLHLRAASARRLYVATNRGSEVFGFDRRAEPMLLWRREATEEENRKLDAVAEEVRDRIERLTGLPIRIVYDRLNRRKIDLIPEPAWADPPKSAIGELLAATEARLRGGGLRQGLREAFELTERIARELGLADAKVTSDVKHIEIGLTDKADAMAYLFREIATPLAIPASKVLVLGDEFGPIAGFEGSDHKMLDVPQTKGAIVVSVGPEPGGAPENVLHLGGGPARCCAIFEHQIALEQRHGAFAAPRDAAWMIEESGFDVAREHEIESLLAIANGYVGSRGSIAEGSSVSRPATFLSGAFELSTDVSPVPELLVLPDWGRMRFLVEDEPLAVESGVMVQHRRLLDMRRGLLLREGLGHCPSGRVTRLRTVHMASLADRHILLEGVEMTPQNYSGTICVEALLTGHVASASGASHWASFDTGADEGGPRLFGRTRMGLGVAMRSRLELEPASGSTDEAALGWERAAGPTWASERCELPVRIADRRELFRTVAVYSSRDVPDPASAADALSRRVAAGDGANVRALLDDHERAWAERWRRADVEIAGAPRIDRALRFALYHLIGSANPEDPRTSIGARALAGEAYRGHVFWDTEIFMLPFFVHGFPDAARALLQYRHVTLGGARRKAARLGYQGALYAWESADTGDETTPELVVASSGQVMRVLSGLQEQHIAADIAHAVSTYERATGDQTFMREAGLEILLETARFWASRLAVDGAGVAHIDEVIGPDEYHEGVDDNAFTNWMARHNLLSAADALERAAPEDAERLGVASAEIARFRDLAARVYLGFDPETQLIEQFKGFHALEPVDLAAYHPRTLPMDVLLGRTRTQASQVIKQADVVQLLALLWDEMGDRARRANFAYYEPKTSHGSSLSPGTHAMVAARLGLHELAAQYLEQTAAIDLGNNMGNAAGGIHAAGLGSLWQAVVLGVGGMRPAPDDVETLILEPRLLPGWRHLGFPFQWRGRWLRVDVEPGGVEISVEGTAPVPVRSGGQVVRAEPGRRYALARPDDGSEGRWEESR
jgi:trehalose/maltose hydrolase-like predicted phosphorylase